MFYFIYFIENVKGFTGCSSFLIISTTFLSSHISSFSFLLSSHCSPSLSLCSLLNFYFTNFSISIFICSQFLFSSFLNFYYLFLTSTVPLFSILFPFSTQLCHPCFFFSTLQMQIPKYPRGQQRQQVSQPEESLLFLPR